MTLDAIDVLIEAKLWIDKGWCQNAFGRTEDGQQALSPATATSVCAIGALHKAAGTDTWSINPGAALDAELLLNRVIDDPGLGIAGFNDTHTKEEVLEAFDRAIELGLEQRGSE